MISVKEKPPPKDDTVFLGDFGDKVFATMWHGSTHKWLVAVRGTHGDFSPEYDPYFIPRIYLSEEALLRWELMPESKGSE